MVSRYWADALPAPAMRLFRIRPRRSAPLDDDWRARFLRGDRALLEEVYRATFAQVQRAAASILREPFDRDAIVQSVYLELIEERAFRERHRGGSVGAYLASVARHRALDFVRRERRLDPLGGSETATADLHAEELRLDLGRHAAQLPDELRRVIELRFLRGLTQVEAAEELGIPRTTLEGREHEAVTLLRQRLLGTPSSIRRSP